LENSLAFRWWMIKPDLFNINAPKVLANPSFIDILYDWAKTDSIEKNNTEQYKIISSVDKQSFFPNGPFMLFFEQAMKEFRTFMIWLSIRSLYGGTLKEEYISNNIDFKLAQLIGDKFNDGRIISRVILNTVLNISQEFLKDNINKIECGELESGNIFNLASFELPCDPMIDFDSNLVVLSNNDSSFEDTLFPTEIFESYFEKKYGTYSKRFARRVKVVSSYLSGESNYIYLDYNHLTEEDGNILNEIEKIQTRRKSIFFYFGRIREIFLQHLEYILSKK